MRAERMVGNARVDRMWGEGGVRGGMGGEQRGCEGRAGKGRVK